MKHLIRNILREETEATLKDQMLDVVKDVGRAGVDSLKRFISTFVGHRPTKARLIFPKDGWETTAVKIAERLGIVTGTYKSLAEANVFLKELKSNGVKLEELLIGSHGSPGNLLSTQKGGVKIKDDTGKVIYEHGKSYYFKTDFLEHIKPVVNPQTKVYFTACYGADKLGMLKEAADYLECECYACMGKNAFSFGCEDSNWSCNANTGVDTLSHKIKSWDQLEVMTGMDTKDLRIAGTGLRSEMWYDFVTDFYQQHGVCQEQPNLPFNWMTLDFSSVSPLKNDPTIDNIYN